MLRKRDGKRKEGEGSRERSGAAEVKYWKKERREDKRHKRKEPSKRERRIKNGEHREKLSSLSSVLEKKKKNERRGNDKIKAETREKVDQG